MPQRHKTRDVLALQLGKLARAAREKAGLTQQETAERVGVVTEVYGRMERGLLLPSLPTLLRPSTRPTRSSGISTVSTVEPSAKSPGCSVKASPSPTVMRSAAALSVSGLCGSSTAIWPDL